MNKNLKKNFIVDGCAYIDNFLTKKDRKTSLGSL